MRRMLVAGNWKMNGTSESVCQLLDGIKRKHREIHHAELAVFPPYVFLDACQKSLADTAVKWGAQNVCDSADGAFTGEISASMLQEFGCQYVIVGHSERRVLYGESNETVCSKFVAASVAGLQPILCIGESLEQREAGQTLRIVQEQLAIVLSLKDNLPALSKAVVAYEPIWAIGTGKTATPEEAETVHCAIRKQLADAGSSLADEIRILYGGSVKPDNAEALFAMPNIDGALVGGASLDADKFIAIGNACSQFS